MKQLIVLIATVVLGLSISGVIFGMGDGMDKLSTGVQKEVTDLITSEAGITL